MGKKIGESIKKNKKYLQDTIGTSTDIQYRQFVIPAMGHANALLVYISNMVDNNEIDEAILRPLMMPIKLRQPLFGLFSGNESKLDSLINTGVFIRQARKTNDWEEACDQIVQGNACLFTNGCSTAVILYARNLPSRQVSEPLSESEIRGPRDSFIENIGKNIAIIRSRIKDYGLRFDTVILGRRTKTAVTLAYVNSLVDDSILGELRSRLDRIDVDGILASGVLEEYIEDAPYSIFPQIEHTERPDKACAAILEGRIVLLVDNTPVVLIVPTVFWNYIQTPGDYYDRFYLGTFFRWVRLLALMLSFTLSSLYVLLATYHQEMLPTILALKIAQGREGVPFPALIEAFIMDILLEVIKEAGLRMPNPVGPTVSIVGTFILGQAAILAGIASPTLIIFITISAICSYAIPNYSLNNSLRLIRFPLLILSGVFGILGFFAGIIALMVHVLSLRSFGVPFMAPVIPFDEVGVQDTVIRVPWWRMKKRSGFTRPKDKVRQGQEDLKPAPPKGKP